MPSIHRLTRGSGQSAALLRKGSPGVTHQVIPDRHYLFELRFVDHHGRVACSRHHLCISHACQPADSMGSHVAQMHSTPKQPQQAAALDLTYWRHGLDGRLASVILVD